MPVREMQIFFAVKTMSEIILLFGEKGKNGEVGNRHAVRLPLAHKEQFADLINWDFISDSLFLSQFLLKSL